MGGMFFLLITFMGRCSMVSWGKNLLNENQNGKGVEGALYMLLSFQIYPDFFLFGLGNI